MRRHCPYWRCVWYSYEVKLRDIAHLLATNPYHLLILLTIFLLSLYHYYADPSLCLLLYCFQLPTHISAHFPWSRSRSVLSIFFAISLQRLRHTSVNSQCQCLYVQCGKEIPAATWNVTFTTQLTDTELVAVQSYVFCKDQERSRLSILLQKYAIRKFLSAVRN